MTDPLPWPDVVRARWETWDGGHDEILTVRREHGGWTAEVLLSRERAHVVIRLGPDGAVQQLLLFRDLPEPDLWLGHDGTGRWGEVNGVRRPELDGAHAAGLAGSAGTAALVLATHATGVGIGEGVEIDVVEVDVGTLEVRRVPMRLRRLDEQRWERTGADGSTAVVEVDECGFALDAPQRFRRRD